MDSHNIDNMTLEDAIDFFKDNVDALVLVDGKVNKYKSIIRKGIFNKLLKPTGEYNELIEKLWYHLSKSSDNVSEKYKVFIPTSGHFSGKYARRVSVKIEETLCVIQVSIYPLNGNEKYLFVLDELDDRQSVDESLTTEKVKSFQNTYLFSMYIDLEKDSINSISVTELSDDIINQELKFSQWRLMIVNAINTDYQAQFMEWTEPEYLKNNFAPGKTASFDCLMMNLEGKEIWVKLIFSRVQTTIPDDYRFVYMVQDINETTLDLIETMNRYEDLASKDPLTQIYNHGRMETEIKNAINKFVEEHIPVSLMIMDIDFFKHVNDNYGHAVGDLTLKRFANIVTDYFDDNNGVVGRWGGEEFVAVCCGAGRERALEMAEEIRQKVSFETFANVGNITCSVGVTTVIDGDDFEKAYRRMDNALYEAKSSGRNCVRIS